MELIDIREVVRAHRGHWFDAATMKFFSSRVAQTATVKDGKAYFVSSEQFERRSPRLYSVRVCDMTTGDINTVGKFQEYETSQQAIAAIKKLVS